MLYKKISVVGCNILHQNKIIFTPAKLLFPPLYKKNSAIYNSFVNSVGV